MYVYLFSLLDRRILTSVGVMPLTVMDRRRTLFVGPSGIVPPSAHQPSMTFVSSETSKTRWTWRGLLPRRRSDVFFFDSRRRYTQKTYLGVCCIKIEEGELILPSSVHHSTDPSSVAVELKWKPPEDVSASRCSFLSRLSRYQWIECSSW